MKDRRQSAVGPKSSAALAFRLKTDIQLPRNCILARRFPAVLLEPRPESDAFWSRGCCQMSVLGNCGAVPAGGTEARYKYLMAR
ncbi:uncharacterized protein LY79DRAFT_589894 [Colletotrichum navitas]|uniref:Uncharacterized protein n=1 Tax=Colletotrichum navitas TaxID=681940 RepID=A0AAD8V3T1_9PEZI|nr:uncharacterized protein LY79DRAFT_589894 [Colletotrichum navitas]KAK1593267.1 hypothetical protein LY79DRAFT_589894 [Colletotrichum navitas]